MDADAVATTKLNDNLASDDDDTVASSSESEAENDDADKGLLAEAVRTTIAKDKKMLKPTTTTASKPLKQKVAVVKRKSRVYGKRHRNQLKRTKPRVSQSAVRRLARRAGVLRMAKCVYGESRATILSELHDIVRNAVSYAKHCRRSTVNVAHVTAAAQRRGVTLYGYE